MGKLLYQIEGREYNNMMSSQEMTLYDDCLVIKGKGILSNILMVNDETKMFFDSIINVTYREAGFWGRGILKIATAALTDSHNITFSKKDNVTAKKIVDYINEQIDQIRSGARTNAPAGNDLSEQLEKIAKLYKDGVLSEEEYTQAKKNILV